MPGISTMIGIGVNRHRSSPYWKHLSTEYQAIVAAMTGTKPSNAVMKAQNDFILYLKGANSDSRNVWAKLACIIPYFAGMPTAADALIWWNNPSRKGALHGTVNPSYSIKNGFVGNSAQLAYIDTTFNPLTDGGTKYTQNDCSAGWWFTNNRIIGSLVGSGIQDDMGVFPLMSTAPYKIYGYAQGPGGYPANPAPGLSTQGLFTLIRTSATSQNGFFNKVSFGSAQTVNSQALPNLKVFSLAMNNLGSPNYYQDDTIGLEYWGASLDVTDVKVMVDACTALSLALLTLSSFSDSCDATSIDTNKWTITNPDPLKVVFSQNVGLLMDEVGSVAATIYTNKVQSKLAQLWGVWEFDALYMGVLQAHTAFTTFGLWGNGIGSNNESTILLYVGYDPYSIMEFILRVYNEGTSTYIFYTGVFDTGKFRIVVTPFEEIKLYQFVNDVWVQLGVTQYLPKVFKTLNTDKYSFYMSAPGNNEQITVLHDLNIYSQ